MSNIPIKKFSAGTRSKRMKNERGQSTLEYILVLMVVVSVIFVVVRPVLGGLTEKIQEGLKGGFFQEDNTGSNFYYFSVR